jgi:uncharacterized membrane protein YhaH (DUF805 family)
MGPVEAVQTCLRKYIDFSGRAARPEFWWFFLFYILAAIVIGAIDAAIGTYPLLYVIVALGLFLPALAAQIRRLHDTDRSGWWVLIGLIPLIGTIWLLVLLASQGTAGPNRYGPPSMTIPAAA